MEHHHVPALRVCPHCCAYGHAAEHWIPHSTYSISFLATTPSIVVFQYLNLLVYCQKGCFLLYLEEQSSSSWSLTYWVLGNHAEVSSKDRNLLGKFCQPGSSSPTQLWATVFGPKPSVLVLNWMWDSQGDLWYLHCPSVVLCCRNLWW